MFRLNEKLPIQILFYIRQAKEITLSDLFRILSKNNDLHRVTIKLSLLNYLCNLCLENYIRLESCNSNNGIARNEIKDENSIRKVLGSVIKPYSSHQDEKEEHEADRDKIFLSLTDHFYDVQQTIGFSVSEEMSYLQERIARNSLFGEVDFSLNSNVFVIMPFSKDLKPVYEDIIEPICKELGYFCKRADLIDRSSVIINDIWSLIYNSDIIICDCTQRNPNVFYELGLAHALGKRVICITQNSDDIPFDIERIRYIKYIYDPCDTEAFRKALERYLRE